MRHKTESLLIYSIMAGALFIVSGCIEFRYQSIKENLNPNILSNISIYVPTIKRNPYEYASPYTQVYTLDGIINGIRIEDENGKPVMSYEAINCRVSVKNPLSMSYFGKEKLKDGKNISLLGEGDLDVNMTNGNMSIGFSVPVGHVGYSNKGGFSEFTIPFSLTVGQDDALLEKNGEYFKADPKKNRLYDKI